MCIRQCGVCRKNNARLIVSSLSLALVLSVCEDHEDKLPTVLRYESPVAGQKGEVGGGGGVCVITGMCVNYAPPPINQGHKLGKQEDGHRGGGSKRGQFEGGTAR